MGNVARRRNRGKRVSLLENPPQRKPHPQRGAHHGHREDPPNETLREHRHLQGEIYLVLEGTGSVTIDGKTRPVGAGTSVYIPGNALHSCENTGEGDLRFAYVFAANSFEEVEYVFEE